ncbi:MAG: hypothetical protein CBC47_05100 [Alphaproteobacteria bacterium TMED87]|nr:hypothetical protein [Rhodospirillaceae bacterium]OUV09462.1 MAG: hypothetical protein CBC47_05100 [Alphaproteobacteria bacterium TMED87]
MPLFLSSSSVLFIFWLILSGHYTPFLLVIGIISCVFIVILVVKMEILDDEALPIKFLFSAIKYWPWLFGQIIQSALNVAKIIINPNLPITPTMIKIKPLQETDVGVVTFANSITLTPGTISVEIDNDNILVHAITRDNAFDLEQGVMNEKCKRFEGKKNNV